MKAIGGCGLALLALSFTVIAYSQEGDQPKRERRGPPPVAIEACTALVDGDMCSFEGRRGDAISGICAIDREEVLACRPEHRPPQGQ